MRVRYAALLLLGTALFLSAALPAAPAGKANLGSVVAAADAEDKPAQRPLRGDAPHFSKDPTVKIDYDIVYVRAPRFVKGKDGKEIAADVWPGTAHPFNVCAVTDLMLLHPDGSEEVLVAGGTGAIADPYVSFDAAWVYYTHFHDLSRNGPYSCGGADIYKVQVKTRKIVRLTQQQFTPNTGVADWSADYQTPEKGKVHLNHRVVNMDPCPLPGGRIAFVSTRDGFNTPRGSVQEALQLFVMDDDGTNVEKIGYLNVAGALHPVVLKDGRIVFSSFESMGMRGYGGPSSIYAGFWGLWSIHPDGTNWAPLVSAYRNPTSPKTASHFQTQLTDGSVVVNNYYELAWTGFGTYLKLPPQAPEGVPAFGPAKPAKTTDGETFWRFKSYGTEVLTPFNFGLVGPGKKGYVTHPCGAPENHLLTVWTPNEGLGTFAVTGIHGGIYLIKNGQPVSEPGAMLLIKHDANYNQQWPRPLVSYKRIYGQDEPNKLAASRNDGTRSKHLPEGTPFGLIGSSSLYKRETFPDGQVPEGSVTATGDPYAVFPSSPPPPPSKNMPWGWPGNLGRLNWQHQGADAGLYTNSDIHAIRIVALEPASIPVAGKFLNRAGERLRILGEIPVRKFAPVANAVPGAPGSPQPVDPDGNPDTSFLARIPADMAWTFQTLDKNGMVLNMSQTWHQLRPGEIRTNCGGCHAHSQKPTLFQDTAAARADYQIFDLTKSTPLLTDKKNDRSGKKWDTQDETGLRFAQGVHNVEYYRDIQPILERSCVACHSGKSAKPAGNLVLDDNKLGGGKYRGAGAELGGAKRAMPTDGPLPATYRTLTRVNQSMEADDVFDNNTKVYLWHFRSRNSPLIWKIYGRRTDGLPEKPLPVPSGAAKHKRILDLEGDFKGSVMPPPEAVAGTYEAADGKTIKVAPLTDEQRRTLVRWIDLGCPIDRDYDPKAPEKPGYGWMLDDQRPTLALTYPQAGVNESLKRLLVGMYDYGTGLDLNSFTVVADFPIDGVPAGANLAQRFKALPDYRWELQLERPITDQLQGKLTVSIKDKQGNVSRIERTFVVAAPRK